MDPDCRQQRFESVERKIPSEYLPNKSKVLSQESSLLDDYDIDLESIEALFKDYENRKE